MHEAEVAQLAAAADAAAAGNDATALGAAIDAAKPLAAHLPAKCLARAEAKYRAMNAAKSMAETACNCANSARRPKAPRGEGGARDVGDGEGGGRGGGAARDC